MKFFVSYSRSVKQDVGQVLKLLKAAGHEVWWDGDIPTIEDWWATILKKIEWCEVFIFMISEKSVQSPYCLAELRYAIDRNRPVLPFILDDHTRYTIPGELGRRQWFVHDGDPARMLAQIMQDCGQLDLKKYPDTHSPRPVEPNTGAGTLAKQFQQAVSLAEDGRFEEAAKRFRNVASLDYQEWGEDCQRWVSQIQLYAEIADLADHKATLNRAHAKWEQYLKQYDTEFDPLKVREKLAVTPAKPAIPSLADATRRTLAVLAPPFEWVHIPAGKVTLGGNHGANRGYIQEATTFDLPVFAIAKYPLTNAQFRKFVKDVKGYTQRKWWTDAGWQVKEKEKWTQPRFWTDKQWNGDEYPVVGVSWYEAVAFCNWLSEAVGDKIALPTDPQWQRAARALPDGGDSGYAYPWGDDWDGKKCNNRVKPEDSNRTSPVTHYEKLGNVSPCGVVDLAGNVWEWCLTAYETGSDALDGTDVRVLRGGSWVSIDAVRFRVVYRFSNYPYNQDFFWGFRVSRF